MRPPNTQTQVQQAACSFDEELHAEDYDCIHADAAQLHRLLSYLPAAESPLFVDLGTGSGYVATAIADTWPRARVLGLDIARKALATNRTMAAKAGLTNLSYLETDGVHLPLESRQAAAVVSRYMFHHLPQPKRTLREIHGSLDEGGVFLLADAIRDPRDEVDFINRFQALKQDGHVCMDCGADLIETVCHAGFQLVDTFDSAITFSRANGPEYEDLLAATPPSILQAYEFVREDKAYRLRLPIFNGIFRKLG